MTAPAVRRTVPLDPWGSCLWCGRDPDTVLCCGGQHPDRHALDAAVAAAPEITLRPLVAGEMVAGSAFYDIRRVHRTIGGRR